MDTDPVGKILAATPTALVPTLLLIGGWAAGYFSSYMSKKGENLATHEDLGKLVKQMEALTEAQKTIESKISGEAWDRQKRWEMKREVLFDAAKKIAEIDNALLSLDSVNKIAKSDDPSWLESRRNVLRDWSRASTSFDQTRVLVAVVCTKETTQTFDDLGIFINALAGRVTRREQGAYTEAGLDLAKRLFVAKHAIRRELGVEDAKPESNVS